MKTFENEIAFFIKWENGAVDAFDTEAERAARIEEYNEDQAAWFAV